ncbi:MAG: hypothetical protein ACPGUF_07550 [Litorivicinus sp.]
MVAKEILRRRLVQALVQLIKTAQCRADKLIHIDVLLDVVNAKHRSDQGDNPAMNPIPIRVTYEDVVNVIQDAGIPLGSATPARKA